MDAIEKYRSEPDFFSPIDFILESMTETLARLLLLYGSQPGEAKVKLGDREYVLRVEHQSPFCSPDSRLRSIVSQAKLFLSVNPDYWIDKKVLNRLVRALLIADGWDTTRFTLRTPLWMFDSKEYPWSDLRKMEGLEWLGRCRSLWATK